MATDFRDGRTFPRRGRQSIDNALWLARIFDKARAAANGTIHDYIYPCGMDMGVLERWKVTPAQFNDAIRMHSTDETLYAWLLERAGPDGIRAANAWLLEEKVENLDRQDTEEGCR